MHTVRDADNVPKVLCTYLDKEIFKNMSRSSVNERYQTIVRGKYSDFGGLRKWLERRYYPHYTPSKRRFQKGKTYKVKASSDVRGKRVDRELSQHIFDQTAVGKKRRKRNGPRKRKPDKLTQGILRFWRAKGHVPVASQVPVELKRIGRMTEADVVTVDPKGQLYMWEVKTCGVGIKQHKGEFKAPYDSVPCTLPNQWELQRHYTHQGMVQGGLPLTRSFVLHATELRNGHTSIRAMPNAKWIKP